jgi:hypothetical protein
MSCLIGSAHGVVHPSDSIPSSVARVSRTWRACESYSRIRLRTSDGPLDVGRQSSEPPVAFSPIGTHSHAEIELVDYLRLSFVSGSSRSRAYARGRVIRRVGVDVSDDGSSLRPPSSSGRGSSPIGRCCQPRPGE